MNNGGDRNRLHSINSDFTSQAKISARMDFEQKRIIAVGGGKGGVGKTVIAASLAAGLAMSGKRVVVVDGDLGGANLHAVVGMKAPKRNYSDFFNRKVNRLQEVVAPHPTIENLGLISGSRGALGIANLTFYQKMKFIRHLDEIEADFVILDLGAGSDYNMLDLFLAADQGLVVVNPEPLSIQECVDFLRQVFYRKLCRIFRNQEKTEPVIKTFAGAVTFQERHSVGDLIDAVAEIDLDAGQKVAMWAETFKPGLLINGVGSNRDIDKGMTVLTAIREELLVEMPYWGKVRDDQWIKRSLDAGEPFIVHRPRSRAARELWTIIDEHILNQMPDRMLSTVDEQTEKASSVRDDEEVDCRTCSAACRFWSACEFQNMGEPCALGWEVCPT